MATTITRIPKKNGYSNAHLHAKRNRKRKEAESRQAHYNSLSLAQKIALVESRPGQNKRELARLNAQLAAIKPEPATTAKPKAVKSKKATGGSTPKK